jgi:hypothetical protein
MATNTDNVLVALTGAVYAAPMGTTLPDDTGDSWNAAFKDLGYISEDGITEAHEDDVAEIPAWQNGQIVRRMIKGTSCTYTFTVIETTKTALEIYYKGATVTGTHASGVGPASIEIGTPQADRRAWGFDVLDGDKIVRWVVPEGEVTERGEVVYKNDEPFGYELTITAYPGDDGVHTFKYFSDLAGLPAS